MFTHRLKNPGDETVPTVSPTFASPRRAEGERASAVIAGGELAYPRAGDCVQTRGFVTGRTLRPKHAVHRAARWLGLGLLAFGGISAAGESSVAKEALAKATFVYNFTKFVEWPAERLGAPETPFVIGVFAGDGIRAGLERVARGQRVNGHPVEIRLLHRVADAADVHVLFVGRGTEGGFDGRSAMPGLLAVGESEAFLERGGTIAFTVVEDQLRFTINMEAATRAGLKISAQLQKLAIRVRKAP